MKAFLEETFLLESDTAIHLYQEYATKLPIIDYHCHLSPKEITEDRAFENITQAWLAGDHYKWRAMRALGIDEHYITGQASDREKFGAWAKTVPFTMRNPLYHWTHMELKRPFGIRRILDEQSATGIYSETESLLQQPDFTTRGILKKMRVELVCTTDDPLDDLQHHQKQAGQEDVRVLPTFRPDKAYAVDDLEAWNAYLDALSEVSNIEISSFYRLMDALESRITYFHEIGCRLADHGLTHLHFKLCSNIEINNLFIKMRQGKKPTPTEKEVFRYAVLIKLSRMYHARGWTQQFHLGALRNTNQLKLEQNGPDTGYDSIGDFPQARKMARFFNRLQATDQLAKTIIYNLNPADNEVFATMAGNFQEAGVKGKIQWGSAWWFLDQKDGMEKQLNTLSNMGLLATFIGMLTDSRSFLSYPRHEYFRRILCNLLGNDVEKGLLPKDEKWLGKLVSDICYHNAKSYFAFEETTIKKSKQPTT